MLAILQRAALALGLASMAAAAAAGCEGPSLIDLLDDQQRADLATASSQTPFGNGFLWSASRGDARVLLVGTMHLYDDRHLDTLDRLAPAIQDADLILLEATPVEHEAISRAMVETPERVFITEGPTLPDLLGDSAWAALSERLKERGMPPFLAAKFRPWFLMMSLAIPPCALADASAGLVGLDGMIMEAAMAADVPLAALEPWDTLFLLMERDSQEEQIEALRTAFLVADFEEESIVAAADSYFAGRVGEVLALSHIATELLPPEVRAQAAEDLRTMEEQLLVDRNRSWIPVIENAATDDARVIVAAGAGHLPGEAGVLRLLESRGWSIDNLDRSDCCGDFWSTP